MTTPADQPDLSAWQVDANGDFVNPPPPPYLCRTCGGLLVWRRTPLLPEPAGIWGHDVEPEDDHALVVPWEGSGA